MPTPRPRSSSSRNARAGVYVHFPWCLAKCPYCDFVSYAAPRESIDSRAYADAVLRELDARAAAIGARAIGSVFFGGGTPSLWDPNELGRVLAGIRGAYACEPDLEVTVECNPTSLDRPRADALAAVGVNRLSVGTQSLDAAQLRFLGRLHDPAGAMAAVDGALASDVARVSTDLIFGLPEQLPADARAQAIALAERESGGRRLTHLSCYQLTIEPGTQFGALAKRGRLPLADDGLVTEAFLAIDEALAERGHRHYEISNYALPGDEARHNLGYWRGEEYVGLGCAAYGMLRLEDGTGLRYRNAIDPRAYVEATRHTKRDRVGEGDAVTISSEPLDALALLRERIMLGLRLADGFDTRECGHRPGDRPVDRRADARGRAAGAAREARAGGGPAPGAARGVDLDGRHGGSALLSLEVGTHPPTVGTRPPTVGTPPSVDSGPILRRSGPSLRRSGPSLRRSGPVLRRSVPILPDGRYPHPPTVGTLPPTVERPSLRRSGPILRAALAQGGGGGAFVGVTVTWLPPSREQAGLVHFPQTDHMQMHVYDARLPQPVTP